MADQSKKPVLVAMRANAATGKDSVEHVFLGPTGARG
jgi:hypothetical protein